jgi:flagellar motor switch protein FliN
LLESVSCYVNGVADPFGDGTVQPPAPRTDELELEAVTADASAEDELVAPAAAAPAAGGIDALDAQLAAEQHAEALAAAILGETDPAPVAAAPIAEHAETRVSAEAWASLLSGVEVELSAELGRTDLALGDITSLTSERVLTLDQLVDEPVLVHVNGTPYATARLVVVDGEYGIEILEVMDQSALFGAASSLAA